MDPAADLHFLLTNLPAGVRIVKKADSRFWRFLDVLVKIVTLGKNKTFLSSFVTTIGNTIAVPTNWEDWPDAVKVAILEHELVHVGQFAKYGLIPTSIAYLLLPLPIGLAYCRYRLERVAYLHGIKVEMAYYPGVDRDSMVECAVKQLTGPNYGWTWPFRSSVRNWFRKELGL